MDLDLIISFDGVWGAGSILLGQNTATGEGFQQPVYRLRVIDLPSTGKKGNPFMVFFCDCDGEHAIHSPQLRC